MDAQMRIWLEAEMSIWHRYLVNTLSPGFSSGCSADGALIVKGAPELGR
jgi:hypothetical protein